MPRNCCSNAFYVWGWKEPTISFMTTCMQSVYVTVKNWCGIYRRISQFRLTFYRGEVKPNINVFQFSVWRMLENEEENETAEQMLSQKYSTSIQEWFILTKAGKTQHGFGTSNGNSQQIMTIYIFHSSGPKAFLPLLTLEDVVNKIQRMRCT